MLRIISNKSVRNRSCSFVQKRLVSDNEVMRQERARQLNRALAEDWKYQVEFKERLRRSNDLDDRIKTMEVMADDATRLDELHRRTLLKERELQQSKRYLKLQSSRMEGIRRGA